ncbi:MAG: hypothetical protein Q8N85_01280 [Candidatus Omnitrophota bacterium]|nr:hypothetical protein [Candidatus Omnitrophota bacterium]
MYSVEFTLHTYDVSAQTIRNALLEFGAGLAISERQESQERGWDFQVQLNTDNPEAVFDICAQFGRIKSVKIDEMKLK